MEEKGSIISVDFQEIFKILWERKVLLISITFFLTIVGTIYAFVKKEEFIAEGRLLPEVENSSTNNLGGLVGLAALGGVNLNGSGNLEAIRPDLYPDVLKSTPFFLKLFQQKFIDLNGDSLKFETFYIQKVEDNKEIKREFLTTYKGQPKGVVILSRQTELRIEDLTDRIESSIDKKNGVISISTKLPDPVVAAEVTKFAINYLTEYVTTYRTEKIKQEVDFLGRKVAASKGEYYQDQARKALYSDANSLSSIRLQTSDMQRERIESEYRMSSSLYTELLKRYEEAKIKLHQQTPVFQILDPPIAPAIKSEPKKGIIIFASFTIGLFVSILTCLSLKSNESSIFIRI